MQRILVSFVTHGEAAATKLAQMGTSSTTRPMLVKQRSTHALASESP